MKLRKSDPDQNAGDRHDVDEVRLEHIGVREEVERLHLHDGGIVGDVGDQRTEAVVDRKGHTRPEQGAPDGHRIDLQERSAPKPHDRDERQGRCDIGGRGLDGVRLGVSEREKGQQAEEEGKLEADPIASANGLAPRSASARNS